MTEMWEHQALLFLTSEEACPIQIVQAGIKTKASMGKIQICAKGKKVKESRGKLCSERSNKYKGNNKMSSCSNNITIQKKLVLLKS